MNWKIYDEKGKQHEITKDERVLVLGCNQECARETMRRFGLPPYSWQFRVNLSPRALDGTLWAVIIRTSCFYRHRDASMINRVLERIAQKMAAPPRTILVDCR